MGQSFRKPVSQRAPAGPHTTVDVSILPSISVPQKQDGCSVVQQATSSTVDNSNFPDSSVTSLQQPVEVFMKTSPTKAFVYDIVDQKVDKSNTPTTSCDFLIKECENEVHQSQIPKSKSSNLTTEVITKSNMKSKKTKAIYHYCEYKSSLKIRCQGCQQKHIIRMDPPNIESASQNSPNQPTTAEVVQSSILRESVAQQPAGSSTEEVITTDKYNQELHKLDIPTPENEAACIYCGYISSLMNRCQRCKRSLLGAIKLADVCHTPSPLKQTQFKCEEPPCVTVSSSEDEDDVQATSNSGEPGAKRSRTEEESSKLMKIIEMIETVVQQEPRGLPLQTEDAGLPERLADKFQELHKWQAAGLKGSFFSLRCRSIRIGSYSLKPIDRILISSEGMVFDVPLLTAGGKPSVKETAKLVLSKTQIMKVDIPFGKNFLGMFIHLTRAATRDVRDCLRMSKDVPGVWFDSLSEKDSDKRIIILLPDDLSYGEKSRTKSAFKKMGVINKITVAKFTDILVRSCYSI